MDEEEVSHVTHYDVTMLSCDHYDVMILSEVLHNQWWNLVNSN